MTSSATQPKISIVTPSFNQATFLEEALWSVKNQNYPHVEHIVVDGASTDASVEILRRYASLPGWEHLRWLSEPDRGQSDALNKGFQMATGDIVGWLNSDDRYRPDCFKAVIGGFDQHPHADVLYADYTFVDEKGRLLQVRREISFSHFVLLYHRVLFIPTTATFFRRRIFEDGNFLDLSYNYSMDHEFFVRLARRGYRFQHMSEVIADFRWQPNSKSSRQAHRQFEERDEIVHRYCGALGGQRSRWPQKFALTGLRAVAATLRYGEKLFRGYYFEQYLPGRYIERTNA